MSAIELSKDGQVAAVFPLEGPIVSIGRNPECDIHLADKKVSGLHALISRQDNAYYIEDAASTNGLEVNGEPRQSSTRLKLGDDVVIAGYHLKVIAGESHISTSLGTSKASTAA